MAIQAESFPYATTVVSKAQYDAHMQLYTGYVAKVNQPGTPGDDYRGWKKAEIYALDGVILHELYFQGLNAGGQAPGEKFTELATQAFGSFARWREDFVACAGAARGWCIAVYDQRTRTLRNALLDTHDEGHIAAAYPLLALDMYEHAYFLDYTTDKGKYIEKFLENVNWDVVEQRAGLLWAASG
jgi:Fe-Mn family superoxide dismutase